MPLGEYRRRITRRRAINQPLATLEDQDTQTRGRQASGQACPPHAGTKDDDIGVVHPVPPTVQS